jgi:hypothetical protein
MESVITIIQVVLAFVVTFGGFAKLILSYTRFSSIPAVAWSKEFKPGHIRLLGLLEVAAGFGLIIPLFVPSLALLAVLGALGCALYMAGAMAIHLRRSEYGLMVGNLMVFIIPALLLAYGRLVGFAV